MEITPDVTTNLRILPVISFQNVSYGRELDKRKAPHGALFWKHNAITSLL